MISVSICAPGQDIAADWDDLVRRASPNVFMDPAVLRAACDLDFAAVQMLLAWDEALVPARLVGIWGLRLHRVAPFWPATLEALPYHYAFRSSPVIDPAYLVQVVPAFLDALARSKLPKVINLRQLDAECPSYAAVVAALAERGRSPLQLAADQRPIVTREVGVKKSGSTRKKMRQDWNRLSAIGDVEVVNDRAAADVRAAFEVFLELEAAGWKGASGTALLSHAEDAAFVRRMIAVFADRAHASVALLRVDGRVVAGQVVLYCGDTAYTWKTAYDESFSRYSPGALLVDKVTESLFAGEGIESIDSCSDGAGFMAQIWTGRRAMVDLLIDVGRRPSLAFALEAGRRTAYYRLRSLRDQLRSRKWLQKPRKRADLKPVPEAN